MLEISCITAGLPKNLQWAATQSTITGSKLTIKTLEQGVEHVQS